MKFCLNYALAEKGGREEKIHSDFRGLKKELNKKMRHSTSFQPPGCFYKDSGKKYIQFNSGFKKNPSDGPTLAEYFLMPHRPATELGPPRLECGKISSTGPLVAKTKL